jgi:hypothetical protein
LADEQAERTLTARGGFDMPRHGRLNLKKFLGAVDYQLLERYFVNLTDGKRLPQRILMNDELTMRFLQDPKNAQTSALVLEDFSRINDLARAGTSTLIWTYGRYGIAWKEKETPTHLALRLFVERPDAFREAYAWYTWHSCQSRMSEYRLPSDSFDLTEERTQAFRQEITGWFSKLAKGDVTEVNSYEHDGATVILITHGTYMHTIAAWDDGKVEIQSLRPAMEDMLMYDPDLGTLRVKATLAKDRRRYVQAFAGRVLEDEMAADRAEQRPAYTLEPFRAGSFDYGGNRQIRSIVLLEAKLQLDGKTQPKLHLKSSDLSLTLSQELRGLSLAMGALTYVRLRFTFPSDGGDVHENVEITPPESSDLATRKHQGVISAYLKAQGVKLI